ncbi:hypothetical protein PIB30_035637 [Stylosanthes scabra]|uniref:Uncharacterized protein n=1 Tax=Stylosanthes scabra TaxID=79078 RepID=A0ABU6ZAW8_9FABA|nr:hypothetical protein [Stylosanthes scabra]
MSSSTPQRKNLTVVTLQMKKSPTDTALDVLGVASSSALERYRWGRERFVVRRVTNLEPQQPCSTQFVEWWSINNCENKSDFITGRTSGIKELTNDFVGVKTVEEVTFLVQQR